MRSLAPALLILLVAPACSFKPYGDTSTLRISVPESDRSSPIVRRDLSRSFSLARTMPATVDGFSCYAVNVMGRGISSYDNRGKTPDGSVCYYPGVVSPLIALDGGEVSMKVPSGPARTIQMIGINSDAGCDLGASFDSLMKKTSFCSVAPCPDPGFDLHEIGIATADLFGDTTVEIKNTYPGPGPSGVPQTQDEPFRCVAAASSATGGSPLDTTAGKIFHLRADSLPLADGSSVSDWDAIGPNAAVLTKTFVTAVFPTFNVSDARINGMPSVSFTGFEYLYYGDVAAIEQALNSQNANFTVFYVASANSIGNYTVFAKNMGSNPNFGTEFGFSMQSVNLYPMVSVESPDGSYIQADHANSTISSATFNIVSMTYDGASLNQIYLNGANGGLVNTSAMGSPVIGTSGAVVTVGARDGGGQPFNGDLAEIALYDHILTQTERESIECALSKKYGLTLTHGCAF